MEEPIPNEVLKVLVKELATPDAVKAMMSSKETLSPKMWSSIRSLEFNVGLVDPTYPRRTSGANLYGDWYLKDEDRHQSELEMEKVDALFKHKDNLTGVDSLDLFYDVNWHRSTRKPPRISREADRATASKPIDNASDSENESSPPGLPNTKPKEVSAFLPKDSGMIGFSRFGDAGSESEDAEVSVPSSSLNKDDDPNSESEDLSAPESGSSRQPPLIVSPNKRNSSLKPPLSHRKLAASSNEISLNEAGSDSDSDDNLAESSDYDDRSHNPEDDQVQESSIASDSLGGQGAPKDPTSTQKHLLDLITTIAPHLTRISLHRLEKFSALDPKAFFQALNASKVETLCIYDDSTWFREFFQIKWPSLKTLLLQTSPARAYKISEICTGLEHLYLDLSSIFMSEKVYEHEEQVSRVIKFGLPAIISENFSHLRRITLFSAAARSKSSTSNEEDASDHLRMKNLHGYQDLDRLVADQTDNDDASLRQHMDAFLKSAENQDAIAKVASFLRIVSDPIWLYRLKSDNARIYDSSELNSLFKLCYEKNSDYKWPDLLSAATWFACTAQSENTTWFPKWIDSQSADAFDTSSSGSSSSTSFVVIVERSKLLLGLASLSAIALLYSTKKCDFWMQKLLALSQEASDEELISLIETVCALEERGKMWSDWVLALIKSTSPLSQRLHKIAVIRVPKRANLAWCGTHLAHALVADKHFCEPRFLTNFITHLIRRAPKHPDKVPDHLHSLIPLMRQAAQAGYYDAWHQGTLWSYTHDESEAGSEISSSESTGVPRKELWLLSLTSDAHVEAAGLFFSIFVNALSKFNTDLVTACYKHTKSFKKLREWQDANNSIKVDEEENYLANLASAQEEKRKVETLAQLIWDTILTRLAHQTKELDALANAAFEIHPHLPKKLNNLLASNLDEMTHELSSLKYSYHQCVLLQKLLLSQGKITPRKQ